LGSINHLRVVAMKKNWPKTDGLNLSWINDKVFF